MKRLLLATGNPGKIKELRLLLQPLGVSLLFPEEVGPALEVEESEGDYAANASAKARTYAMRNGLWALADDSGLEVEALGGAPGALSARLAGPGSSDHDRRMVLLNRLRSHSRPWSARFRCVVALSAPDGSVDLAQGICLGEVIPKARGAGGFGYDPIFLVSGIQRTMAELDIKEKNEISHRARAVRAILPILRRRLHL